MLNEVFEIMGRRTSFICTDQLITNRRCSPSIILSLDLLIKNVLWRKFLCKKYSNAKT